MGLDKKVIAFLKVSNWALPIQPYSLPSQVPNDVLDIKDVPYNPNSKYKPKTRTPRLILHMLDFDDDMFVKVGGRQRLQISSMLWFSITRVLGCILEDVGVGENEDLENWRVGLGIWASWPTLDEWAQDKSPKFENHLQEGPRGWLVCLYPSHPSSVIISPLLAWLASWYWRTKIARNSFCLVNLFHNIILWRIEGQYGQTIYSASADHSWVWFRLCF